MMSEGQEVALGIVAAAVGTAQPFLLRQYADTQVGTLIPQIGAYGTPSCLAGLIAGGGATAAALVGKMYGKGVTDPFIQNMLLAYGVPAVTASLIIAYLTPTATAAAATTSTAGATTAQGVFRANKVMTPPAAGASAAERNMAKLTPLQRVQKGIY